MTDLGSMRYKKSLSSEFLLETFRVMVFFDPETKASVIFLLTFIETVVKGLLEAQEANANEVVARAVIL